MVSYVITVVSKDMWGEALLCATYLTNRSPIAALKPVSPAEMFYQKIPNIKNIKTFGCIAYSHTYTKRKGGKFNVRSEIKIMVGYSDNGYRLWNPVNKNITLARNVTFDESHNIKNLNNDTITFIDKVCDSNERFDLEEKLELDKEKDDKISERHDYEEFQNGEESDSDNGI